ncbi:3-keto-disaccharide hydrolase [Gemmata sp.]|uniref:3-keto-disaccharide hydrolase n=1 Tax=Gemmata sp. TaxID=1914242 RepID=UPI003F72C2DE
MAATRSARLVLAALAAALVLPAPAPAPAAEGDALFPKDDLAGWVEEQHSFFKAKHPDVKTWSVKGGVVTCDGSKGNCGFLRYDKKLGDFTLRLEYRVSKGCNSGVCVRVPNPYNGRPDETLPSKTGYEVQIQDDAGAEPSTTSSGAFYGVLAPAENAAKAAGEWNVLEVECRGPRLKVTLNGRVVQDVEQVAVGAIKDRPRTGYLLLQNHGHAIEFRNVTLKEDPPGTKQP